MTKRQVICAWVLATVATAHAGDKVQHPESWVFDEKPVTATKPGKGKAEFSINGHVYARVFYDRAIKDVFSLTPSSYQVHVYQRFDDSTYGMVPIWIPKKDFDNTWLDLEILPDPTTAKTKFGAYGETFHKTFAYDKVLEGKHEVYYEVIVGGENGSAPAELPEADRRAAKITIDFTGHDPKKMDKLRQEVAAAGNAAFASNLALPKPGGMHSAALAKQAEAMTLKSNKDTMAAVKVIFTDDDWGLERNDAGAILSRIAGAAAVTKSRAGKCMVEPGLIRQQFVRKKFVAPGKWVPSSGTPYQIECAKAFK